MYAMSKLDASPAGRVGLHPAHRDPQDPRPVPGHPELQEGRARQAGALHRGNLLLCSININQAELNYRYSNLSGVCPLRSNRFIQFNLFTVIFILLFAYKNVWLCI